MYPTSAPDLPPAGFLERASDEIYFRALRALDRFTAFVYCYAPIAVLRRYRGAKNQRATPAPEAVLSQARNQN